MKVDRLAFEIRKARKLTLNLTESFLGTHPQWSFIRSRLLQIFGEHGLESLVKELGQKGTENSNVIIRRNYRNNR